MLFNPVESAFLVEMHQEAGRRSGEAIEDSKSLL